jgi:hypothetical protein
MGKQEIPDQMVLGIPQMFPDQMVLGIPQMLSALDLFMLAILIC